MSGRPCFCAESRPLRGEPLAAFLTERASQRRPLSLAQPQTLLASFLPASPLSRKTAFAVLPPHSLWALVSDLGEFLDQPQAKQAENMVVAVETWLV